MIGFARRNLMVFFRDKSSVFFSLLSVFIIIGLYVLFLGDVWTDSLGEVPGVRYLMDSWIMAGLVSVTSLTTTMGAFGIMVEDKNKKIYKDFYTVPMKRSAVAGGYILAAYTIGLLLSLVSLVLAEIYIIAYGGELLSPMAMLKVVALILLSSLANTSMMFFIVSFFSSNGSFAVLNTIVGTLIGFLTGIYLPIGNLPTAIQYVVKLFPPSHSALLFRQVMMEAPLEASFAGAPEEAVNEFKELMGVTFSFGEYTLSPFISLLVLIFIAVIFFLLSVFKISKKSK